MTAPTFNEINFISDGAKTLTVYMKGKYLGRIISRDGYFGCFYCGESLYGKSHVFEHLNDNRSDNRLVNLVLACISCNNKKPTNETMQKRAMKKLAENQNNSLREKKIQRKETTLEMDVNVTGNKMAREYLEQEIITNDSILFSDALYSIVFLIQERTGHGSTAAVREYLHALTSKVGPYTIIGKGAEREIIKKPEENATHTVLHPIMLSQEMFSGDVSANISGIASKVGNVDNDISRICENILSFTDNPSRK